MDANTPETQAMPGGDPNEGTPVHENPTKPIRPVQDTVSVPTPAAAPAPASTAPPRPTPATPPATPPVTPPATAPATAPARPKGPNSGAIVLGLVALVVAALIIAAETMGLRVDWSALGPGAIVGIGVLLVVLGSVGLVRRNDDDR